MLPESLKVPVVLLAAVVIHHVERVVEDADGLTSQVPVAAQLFDLGPRWAETPTT